MENSTAYFLTCCLQNIQVQTNRPALTDGLEFQGFGLETDHTALWFLIKGKKVYPGGYSANLIFVWRNAKRSAA